VSVEVREQSVRALATPLPVLVEEQSVRMMTGPAPVVIEEQSVRAFASDFDPSQLVGGLWWFAYENDWRRLDS
jgi:hypothetical protein